MLLITVHDKVAGSWSPPSVASNKEAAVRDFRTACSRPGSLISEHPEDFELFVIGEWSVPYESTKVPKLVAFDNFDFVESGVKVESNGKD